MLGSGYNLKRELPRYAEERDVKSERKRRLSLGLSSITQRDNLAPSES